MFFSSINQINRLKSKATSNIYLKITIKKKNLKFKKLVSRSAFGELQLTQISLNFKTSCCNLSKTVCGFFIILILKEIMAFSSQGGVHALCWTKLKTLLKMKRNWKWKHPHIVLERWILSLSSYKHHKFKVKLWWVGACERKKGNFLC